MRPPRGSIANLISRPLVRLARWRRGKPLEVNRAYWLRRFLFGVFVIGILFFFSYLDNLEDVDPGETTPWETAGQTTLVLGIVAFFVDRRIRRNRRAVENFVDDAGDGRQFVLLLRSFGQDNEYVKQFPFVFSPHTWATMLRRPRQLLRQYANAHRFTFESLLRRACKDIGPVVGIGDPSEIVPSAGMITQHVDNDWQNRVVELIKSASVVVLRAGISEGVVFEVGLVRAHLLPERLLVYIGSGIEARNPLLGFAGLHRTDSRKRAEFYQTFRQSAGSSFPRGLPEDVGRHRFIRFEPDWTPVLVSKNSVSIAPGDAERVALWMDLTMTGEPA